MEKPTSGEPQQQEQQPPKRDLLSLPDDLLRICLRALPPALDEMAKRNVLASCKPLAGVVVRTSLNAFMLVVDRGAPAVRTATVLAQLWGEEEEGQQRDRHNMLQMMLYSAQHASPERCLADLEVAGVRLPFIAELRLVVRAQQALEAHSMIQVESLTPHDGILALHARAGPDPRLNAARWPGRAAAQPA